MNIVRTTARILAGMALSLAFAAAHADQLLVTGANAKGNALFNLTINPTASTPPTPVIAPTTTQINSAADAASHGLFDALVWVKNPYCKSVDLVVADATKGQIVRYLGAASVVDSTNCYNPVNGTPTLSPTAKPIFTWIVKGSGPAQPNGISVDSFGNLFVVSSNSYKDPRASVWALPVNSNGHGAYGAPILVDSAFGRVNTLALAETQVASFTAKTGANVTLWNQGDLLVLVGDSFNARLVVYSQSRLYSASSPGAIAASQMPVTPSVAIPFASFIAKYAIPFGMDLWPATPGTNPSVLFPTIDGRILQFDTVQNRFVGNFANGLGFGLQKLKVGTYSNVPYAFVAQVFNGRNGKVLALGAPNANGSNHLVASISSGTMQPIGVAVLSFGSTPVTLPANAPPGSKPCAPPNPDCTFAPLGANVFSTTVQANPNSPALSGAVQETLCTVQNDPRVSFNGNPVSYASWSCSGVDLQIGTGTNFCPTFPTAYVPGSVCGHSGPTGAGFAVVEGTATGVDPNENNAFFLTTADIDQVLPGPINLECSMYATNGIPLFAWGTRSDLAFVEGVIAEDSDTFANIAPYLGGLPGYLMESTNGCDKSTTAVKGPSIFVFGTALSSRSPTYLYSLSAQKYQALVDTISAAAISPAVQTQLQTDVAQVNFYVAEAQNFAAAETQSGADVTSNINCALATIYATDGHVRNNTPAFMSNLVTTPPGGGNQDPAGEIDSRLSNWYLLLNTDLQGLQTVLNGTPPTPDSFTVSAASVPQCTLTPAPYTVGGSVSGLTGTGLVLQDNYLVGEFGGTDTVTLNANGQFAFAPADLYPGYGYNVTVQTQPAGQTCTVTSGSGLVAEGNISNVSVACSANQASYTVSGTITGLTANGLILQSYDGDGSFDRVVPDPPAGAAAFAFPHALANGVYFGVAILNQPQGQLCAVSNGSGTINGANVTTVAVVCGASTQPFIADYGVSPAFDEFLNTSNVTSCYIDSLNSGLFTVASGSLNGPLQGAIFSPPYPPTGAPYYGTDTSTLTCYGPAGIPAFSGPVLSSNPSLPLPTLVISDFHEIDPANGTVAWTTNGSASTSCAIMDEFPNASCIATPTTGLPPNNSTYIYPNSYYLPFQPDTLTLSCTDPTLGTAIKTTQFTYTGPGGC